MSADRVLRFRRPGYSNPDFVNRVPLWHISPETPEKVDRYRDYTGLCGHTVCSDFGIRISYAKKPPAGGKCRTCQSKWAARQKEKGQADE